MSKELVIQSDFNTQLAELDKIQDTCKKLMATKHYQALGESGIHAIMARSKALGIHPFEALNGGFFCISGKVGMSTEMMAALIRQRGHSIQKDPKSNNELCILHGKRADNADTWTCSFSKDDAILAGLWNGPTWKKYPSIMLYNRCMSQLFRQLFPDLSLGAGYVEDELKEITKTGEYQTIDITNCITSSDVPCDTASYVIKPSEKAFTKSKNDKVKDLLKKDDVEPLFVDEIKPTIKVETITTDQAILLAALLNECDPAHKERMLAFYYTKCGCEIIDDLPSIRFEEAFNSAAKNRDQYQAALQFENEANNANN